MHFESPLLAVRDLAASIDFYKRVLGLDVVVDFGANVTLTGGVCLQTLETWREFIEGRPVSIGGNAGSSILRRRTLMPLQIRWRGWSWSMSTR